MDELVKILASVPESDLKVLGLLRQSQPTAGQFLPRGLPRKAYTEAALEMMAYTRACSELAQRVKNLTPAQAAAFSISEYGL